jgi:hypothetical protein
MKEFLLINFYLEDNIDISGPSEADIKMLTDMGFTQNRANKALGETVCIFLFLLV